MKQPVSNQIGFSIVEVIVAAIILSVIVTSVITITRKTTELRINDLHRRTARSLIVNEFENKYAIEMFDSLTIGTFISIETLDVREGSPLLCTLTTVVTADTASSDFGGATEIAAMIISSVIEWSEVDGQSDSVQMTKWISQ